MKNMSKLIAAVAAAVSAAGGHSSSGSIFTAATSSSSSSSSSSILSSLAISSSLPILSATRNRNANTVQAARGAAALGTQFYRSLMTTTTSPTTTTATAIASFGAASSGANTRRNSHLAFSYANLSPCNKLLSNIAPPAAAAANRCNSVTSPFRAPIIIGSSSWSSSSASTPTALWFTTSSSNNNNNNNNDGTTTRNPSSFSTFGNKKSSTKRADTATTSTSNNLPWSPISERLDSFSLHLAAAGNGMEGFRDAVRGSQGYIRPKAIPKPSIPRPNVNTNSNNNNNNDNNDNNNSNDNDYPTGTNDGSPETTTTTTTTKTTAKQSQKPPRNGRMLETPDDRKSRLHKNALAELVVRSDIISDDDGDGCDVLRSEDDRDHCLENFREGRESARYIREKNDEGFLMGGNSNNYKQKQHQQQQQRQQQLRKYTKDKASVKALMELEDRENVVKDSESFRDRPSTGTRTVAGTGSNAGGGGMKKYRVEAFVSKQRMEDAGINSASASASANDDDDDDDEVGGRDSSTSSNTSRSSGNSEKKASSSFAAEEDWVQFQNTQPQKQQIQNRASIKQQETIINGSVNANGKQQQQQQQKGIVAEKPLSPQKFGPHSENFRDGARMSTYQEKSFIIGGGGTTSTKTRDPKVSNKRDAQRSNDDDDILLHETLSGGGEILDNVDSNIVYEAAGSLWGNATTDDDFNYTREQQQGMQPGSSSTVADTATNAISNRGPSGSTGSSQNTLLSMDPTSIDIIPLDVAKADEEDKDFYLDDVDALNSEVPTGVYSKWVDASSGSFVKMFRGSASYIANHRGTLAVYHIPGELLAWEGFPGLMDDIALTWLLGMKIVLVAGCRHQIDIRLDDELDEDGEHRTGGKVMMSSIRVTDEDTLRVVKEEAGFVRFEIERRLAKSLRLHGGLIKGSEGLFGNVVSGNFYSAQPFGVLDGIDYCWTGFPRKVEIERIRQVHETNDIVLLTSLGVSPSGEIFNVNSEFLAASVAGALSASKIIYFNVHGTSFQNKNTKKPVQNLRVSDARNLLAHYKMRIHPKGFCLVDLDEDSPHQAALRAPGSMETLIKVGYSMVALEKGVKRAHILAPENGALVQELYTRDGCGTLISRDIYEGIRRADVNDVSGIYDLIDPLVRQGTLVERPKGQLEKEILSYYVYTRDGLIVACGQLKRFEGGFAEIGCLVVSKDYRKGGRGDAMLGYLERLALQCEAKKVFVLSTQTMEWFVERGFREVQVSSLPPSRQAVYNVKRKSKIYMKEIDGDRDLDAAELWWSNRS